MRVGDLVEAVVSEPRDEGIVVHWDGGEGILPREEVLDEPRAGQRFLLKVISFDERGRPILSHRQVTEADRELFGLQQEAERMRKYLCERRLVPPGKRARPRELPVEARLARWIVETERALERLRRRRARFGLRG